MSKTQEQIKKEAQTRKLIEAYGEECHTDGRNKLARCRSLPTTERLRQLLKHLGLET